MKNIIFIGIILCMGFHHTIAVEKTDGKILIADPILPKKKAGKTKRFFKKLNPFGRSSNKQLSYSQRAMVAHQQAQKIMNANRNSGNYSQFKVNPNPSYGVYAQLPTFSSTGSAKSGGTYSLFPPLYDKVPPIYDKVPPLKNSIYGAFPPEKSVFKDGKANTLKGISNSKMLPMHAVMNQQAVKKSRTMGSNSMTKAQRGAFMQELQKTQKQKLSQKRKVNRALRIKQGREIIKYAANPAKAKASGAGRNPTSKSGLKPGEKLKANRIPPPVPPRPINFAPAPPVPPRAKSSVPAPPKPSMVKKATPPLPPRAKNSAPAPPKPPMTKVAPPISPRVKSNAPSQAVLKRKSDANAKQKAKVKAKKTRKGPKRKF